MLLFFIIHFTFQIDESIFNNADSDSDDQVFCDNKNQIRTIHSNSIHSIPSDVDGSKCYRYTPNSNSNQYIKSFPASYFGLETFADAVPNDSLPPSVQLETSQAQIPESLTIFFDNQNYSALLLPIPIGSNFANAYVPFKNGKEYSTRLCIIKNLDQIIPNKKYKEYLNQDGNLTITINQSHYIVGVVEPSPTQSPIPTFSSLEDVYLVEPYMLSTDPTKPSNGYVFGYPVQNGQGPILIDNKIPLIFGQNSNIFFKISGDVLNLQNIIVKRKPNDSPNATHQTNIFTSPSGPNIVYWSILYQKIGSSSDYSYEITKVKTEIQNSNSALTSISIKFYELSQDGNSLYEYPEDELFSYSLSLAFDAFFVRATDSIRTSGIFFLFGLFGTLWAYYSFQFTV